MSLVMLRTSSAKISIRTGVRALNSFPFHQSHYTNDKIPTSPEMFTKVKERSFISPNQQLKSTSGTYWSKLLPSFVSRHDPIEKTSTTKIPHTFEEALLCQDLAIIVTTPSRPYNIVHVNAAWEKLCGYTRSEVIGKELDFLQGEETNIKVINASLKKLSDPNNHNYEDVMDIYTMNHKKDGKLYTNHVTMGKMKLNETTSDVEFLVGVLEEVKPEDVPLRVSDV